MIYYHLHATVVPSLFTKTCPSYLLFLKLANFFSPEQHICCQIVVAKMQGEQKCLHVVCLSFYFMLMWFCLVVFCGMYICQVTYVASQFPQEDK